MQEPTNRMTQMNNMPTTKLTCFCSTTSSFIRIMWIFFGCEIRANSLKATFRAIWMRISFRPPLVEPAQAPTIINTKMTMRATPGHCA